MCYLHFVLFTAALAASCDNWNVDFVMNQCDVSYENVTSGMINCDSHHCIKTIVSTLNDYEVCLTDAAFQAHVEEYTQLQAGLAKCNNCMVVYAKYQVIEEQMILDECFPDSQSHTCEAVCLDTATELEDLWQTMIRDMVCRMNNPGGCGEMGGVSEGEVYDILTDTDELNKFKMLQTQTDMCHEGCAEKVSLWYDSWSLITDWTDSEDRCIAVSAAADDVSTFDPTFGLFEITDVKCTDTCMTDIKGVRSEWLLLRKECRSGLTQQHMDDLIAMETHFCRENEEGPAVDWETFSFPQLLLGGFVCLFVFVFVYMLIGICIKRYGFGYKGVDQIPHISFFRFCCRPCTPSQKDEDEVALTQVVDDATVFCVDDDDE